jgi:hypothetical protein
MDIKVPALRQHAKRHINMPLSDIKSILKSKYHEEALRPYDTHFKIFKGNRSRKN